MHNSQGSTISLVVEKCHLEPSPTYPLHVLATKYSTNGSSNISEQDSYTLILAHAIGTHKETWEVTMKYLLGLCNTRGSPYRVKDIYSVENPNHGESALLNAGTIQSQHNNSWSSTEYARAIQVFLSASPQHGARVDFSKRKLIGIGHSVGAVSLILTQSFSTHILWTSIIAIEPGFCMPVTLPRMAERLTSMQRWVRLRRDTWATRKHAFKDLQETRVFDQWDPRVLSLYVRYALSDHPASEITPPYRFNGVVTSISKEQEAACYRCNELSNMEHFWRMCAALPVHLVWGDRDEVVLAETRQCMSRRDTESGSLPASIRHVKNAGHMLVQQKPDLVASHVHEILSSMNTIMAVL